MSRVDKRARIGSDYERFVIKPSWFRGGACGGRCLSCPSQLKLRGPPVPFRAAVTKFVNSDEGIAVTEYGLLIALVAVLLIGVVTIFGSSISSWFANKTNKITSF